MEDIRRLEVVERYGQTGMASLYLVLFVVIIAVMIPLGYYITVKTVNQIDQTSFTTAQNTTMTQIKSDTASNFSFMNMIPFVLIAAGILAAIIGIVAVVRS